MMFNMCSVDSLPADIAVVIAVFNAEDTLERCLDSIKGQTVSVSQVIVMDGGSTDSTTTILSRRGDVITHWESAPDNGIYDAWNKALGHVTASWVAFLGADDELFDSQVVERFVPVLEQVDPSVPFIYGILHEVDSQGELQEVHGMPWANVRDQFKYAMRVPHPGMLHRRSTFFTNSAFDSALKIAGDYALLRPVLLKSEPLFVEFVVTRAQEGGVSSHPDRRMESIREVGYVIRSGGDSPSVHWYWALVKNWGRRWIWRILGDEWLSIIRRVYRQAVGRSRLRPSAGRHQTG